MLLFQLLYIFGGERCVTSQKTAAKETTLSIVPDTKIRDLPAFRPAKKNRIVTRIGLKKFANLSSDWLKNLPKLSSDWQIGLKPFLSFPLIASETL